MGSGSADPRRVADRIRRFTDAGFDYAVIEGALAALEIDRRASIARAPERSGDLRRTIRVVRPSAARARKTGRLRMGLGAGSRSKTRPVPYARIHQMGGVIASTGARIRKKEYLRIDQGLLARSIDSTIGRAADREI